MILDDPKKRKPDFSKPASVSPPPVKFLDTYNEAISSGDFSNLVFDNVSGRLKGSKASARESMEAAEKAKPSFLNVMKGLPGGISTVTKKVATDPVDSLKIAGNAFGAFSAGVIKGTLNLAPYSDPQKYAEERAKRGMGEKPQISDIRNQAVDAAKSVKWGDAGDRLEREAFLTIAETKGGMSTEAAESLFDSYMQKRPEYQKDAEIAGDFTSLIIPGVATERLALTGMKYAMPQFAKNHNLAMRVLASGIGGVGANQVALQQEGASAEERLDPTMNLLGFGAGAAFPLLGPAARAAKNVIFRKIVPTRFKAGTVEPVIPAEGEVVTKTTPTAAVVSPEGDLAMGTTNVDAVRNYLRGSGKTNVVINERQAGRLGMTQEGVPITARHTFNPKTGVHEITVSSAADAQTIAHEWGHYIDDEVAREVRGLSRYLFGDATTIKNIDAIEDTFRSLAMRELIDDGMTYIPGEAVDNKMSQLIAAVRSEARALASARPDPRNLKGAKGQSEKLADAVSVALTGPSANRSGAFYKFLQEAKVTDKNLVQALRTGKRAEEALSSAEPTALDRAKVVQREATSEKLGLGDRAPERAQRPGSRFEKSKSQREEETFKRVPERITARTQSQLEGVIAKNKISGGNLVEINVSGKKPVTVLAHAIDRDIIRAIQLGGKNKYMEMVKRRVMSEFGMSAKGAEAYIARRFKELKTFAQNAADEDSFVFVKAVRSPNPDRVAKKAVALEQGTLPKGEDGAAAKTDDTPAPKADDEYEISVDRQDALDEMRMELETAEAGYRYGTSYGKDAEFHGVPSSFPDWAPDGTRSRKMFDIMLKHMKDGTEPPARATKQRELWNIIQERLNKYEARNAAANEADTIARAQREEAIMQRETDEALREYDTEFRDGVKDGEFTRAETPPSERIGFGGDEGRLRVSLDRMETGSKPDTDPFRAEKMTADMDEEVFLNTKILPKIVGDTRIKRTNQNIIDQAAASNMTEAEALNMLQERYGALTPDTRKLFEYGMQKTRDIIAKLDGRTADKLTPEELLAFKNDVAQATQLFEVYTGARTEASNLLRSFGIASSQGEDDVLRGMFEQLQKSGLTDQKDVWKAMAKLHEDTQKSTWYNKYYKVLFSAWLSGPATSARNVFGSVGSIMTNLASKGFNPKTAGELPGAVSNLLKDFRELGLPAARKIMRGEGTVESKFMYDPSFPIAQEAYGKTDHSWYIRAAEYVSRILNAQDIALSKTATAMEARSLRIYKPDISEAVSKAISEQYGLSTVYRGMPRGSLSRGLVEGGEALVRRAPITRMVLPFIRTIGNVADRQFDYMPVFAQFRATERFLMPAARDIAKKYGISGEDEIRLIFQRLKDQQQGRAFMGLAMTAGMAGYAMKGGISGNGPSNYNERLLLERTGWRRNSIKVGNMWVPYTYFGPLTGILALVGNIHDSIEYGDPTDTDLGTMVANGLGGWMQTQLNSSFLKGASDLLDSMKSGDWDKYMKNLGASAVPIPAAYSQTLAMSKNVYSHMVDDPALRQQYETKTVVDSIRLKLGLTMGVAGMAPLNPKSDMFGQPMTLDLIYGLTPTFDKTEKMPVESFLVNNGVGVTIPQRNQTYTIRGKKDTKLTDAQYQQYVRESGQAIYERLQKELPALKKLKGQDLHDRVEEISRIERLKVRNKLR